MMSASPISLICLRQYILAVCTDKAVQVSMFQSDIFRRIDACRESTNQQSS